MGKRIYSNKELILWINSGIENLNKETLKNTVRKGIGDNLRNSYWLKLAGKCEVGFK